MPEPTHFDEMFGRGDDARAPYRCYKDWIDGEDLGRLRKKSAEAESYFRSTGITFNVYGAEEAVERLIPFDVVPRIIAGDEWDRLTRGIEQRVRAINAFIYDVYHRQEIIRAGRIPASLISRNDAFVPEMIGVEPPG